MPFIATTSMSVACMAFELSNIQLTNIELPDFFKCIFYSDYIRRKAFFSNFLS